MSEYRLLATDASAGSMIRSALLCHPGGQKRNPLKKSPEHLLISSWSSVKITQKRDITNEDGFQAVWTVSLRSTYTSQPCARDVPSELGQHLAVIL